MCGCCDPARLGYSFSLSLSLSLLLSTIDSLPELRLQVGWGACLYIDYEPTMQLCLVTTLPEYQWPFRLQRKQICSWIQFPL